MRSTFKILFYARKNYLNKQKKIGIMVRITLNGKKSQFSSTLDVDPEMWDAQSGKATGKSVDAKLLNARLDEIRAILILHHREIEKFESHVTAEKIRNAFLGKEENKQMLLEVFKQHNEDLKKRVGKTITEKSISKYNLSRNRVAGFIKQKYHISDIALKELKYKFINDFQNYLLSDCNYSINSTAKHLQRFKKIITLAFNNGWIHSDPFANFRLTFEKVDRGYLTKEELTAIMQKKFTINRIERVRDIFVFACFTGLAYVDMANLKKHHIQTSFDGQQWIIKNRQKTNIQSNIPLLDIPKMILEKYKGCLTGDKVLPVSSNQNINSYLKEIADLCGIEKNLTFHLARHTFATTVTLSKGVPIETVSKMLGHTSIKTTQIYARITNSKISHDMNKLANELKGMEASLTL